MMKWFFLLGWVLTTQFCFAQNSNYSSLNGPYGGPVRDIVNTGTRLVGAVYGQGIVVSTDNGANWSTSATGLTDYNIRDLEWDPVSGKVYALTYTRLFSSSDGGATWVVVSTSGFTNGAFIKRSSTGNLFVASEIGKIYRSTDNGATWPASASSTLEGSPYVNDFKISSTGYLFVVTGAGVFRSSSPNSPVGFTQFGSDQGLTSSNCYSVALSGSDIYVATDIGPFKSSNNGANWSSIKSNITDANFLWPKPYLAETAGTIFLLNNSSRKLWKTTNGGTSWTELAFPMNNYGSEAFSEPQFFQAETASVLHASYSIGNFRSTDGGLNWVEMNRGITGFDPSRDVLQITDNGRLIYTSVNSFGAFLSIDDGATWDFLFNAPLDRRIHGFKKIGSTIYGYGQGIIKTTNNADSWTEVVGKNANISDCGSWLDGFDNTDASTFYALACNNQITKSTDAGASWTATPITGLPANVYVSPENGFHVHTSGSGFISIYNGNVQKYQIYKINLTTGAATHISPSGYELTSAFTSFNGKLYSGAFVSGSGHRMLFSDDGGQTWTAKNINFAYGRIRVINDNTIFMLYSNALLSTDGGNSWVDTGSFGNGRQASYAIVNSSNHSYIVVNNASIHKSVAPVVPPTAPTGLMSFGHSAFTAGLRWNDNSNNEQYFIVERSEGNNTNYDSIATAAAGSLSFIIANISAPKANTQFYYRVRAVGAGGKSAYSNEVSVTTVPNCQTYTIPLNRSWTATTQNESGVGVLTNATVAITGGNGNYQVNNLTAGATVGISPSISLTLAAGFQEICGHVYMTSINPLYANGNGTWDDANKKLTIKWQTRPNYSPYRTETTVFTLNGTDPAPSAPSNVGAYIKTATEIVVTFVSSQFGQQYQIQRSTTSGAGFADVGSPIISSAANTVLLGVDNSSFAVGTTYYYRVVATALGGATTNSAEVSIQFQTPRFEAISLPNYDFPTQGISWADIDNDGDDDLLVSPFSSPNLSLGVFENKGDGTFDRIDVPGVADFTGLTDLSGSTLRTITVGDVNNDGKVDFLTIGPQTGADLFINNGNKSFARKNIYPGNNSGLAWYAQLADINNDGLLDITFSFDAVANTTTYIKIFTQKSDGDFEAYELGEIAADASLTRGGSWADYDNDGDQDFLRTKYGTTISDFDQLYRNNGNGTFTPLSGTAFETDYELQPRSVSWGDYDNDLDLDVYVVHNGDIPNSMLYRNNGDGTFTRMTSSLLSEPKTVQSFGSAWGDIDNDGDLDIVVANNQRSILYLNDGTGNFSKATGAEYLIAFDVARANIAFALSDYDKNGTLDIATGKSQNSFPTILLKNNLVPGASSRWLELKLQGTISNKSAIGARIVITTPNGKKQMRAITSLTGYGSAGSLVAHFGLGNQSSVSTIEIFWPSGVHQTINNVASGQIFTVIENDGVIPVAAPVEPLHAATNVITSTAITFSFTKNVNPVSGKQLKLYKTTDLATPVFTGNVNTASRSGNTFSFTSANQLEPGVVYTVVLDEGAFVDVFGNGSSAIAASSWQFTTKPPPQIAFTIVPSLNKGFGSKAFEITVTDITTVTSSAMYYRKISGNTFTNMPGVFNSTSGKWEFMVQESFFDDMGLEYYFTAQGNEGREPSGSGTHKTSLKYTGNDTNIPSGVLGFGGQQTTWKIFAIPFDLGSNNSVATVLDELAGDPEKKYKVDWRLITLKDDKTWDEYPTVGTFERGKGYFINILSSATIKIANELQAPPNSRSNLFTINLRKGWNQIGNPYLTTIDWSNVVALNNLSGAVSQLKTYANGSYSNATTLAPFTGGFVLSDNDISGVKIPFQGQTSIGGRIMGGIENTELNQSEWITEIILRLSDLKTSMGGVGMHPEASVTRDEFDDFNPPRFFDYLEINFDHREHIAKKFARDVVPTQKEYVWEFTVDSNLKGLAELSWNNLGFGDNEKELYLFDAALQRPVDMRKVNSYSFNPIESNTFSIYFGENLESKIKPNRLTLGRVFPNPVSDKATIHFALPETCPCRTALEIFDNMGRRVATLIDDILQPNFYAAEWDTSDESFTNGVYTYRLRVSGYNGLEILAGKIVLLRK